MSQWPRWLRWFAVSLGGAFLSAAVFMNMIWLEAQQHPNDWAYGAPRILMFLDPFVITVAGFVALPCGFLAFGLAVLFLNRTVMWKTTALMYSAVLLELVVVGPTDLERALLWAVPALLVAAVTSRLLFSTRSPNEPAPKPMQRESGGGESC